MEANGSGLPLSFNDRVTLKVFFFFFFKDVVNISESAMFS